LANYDHEQHCGENLGLAIAPPKKLKCSGIKLLLERALWEQGIRQSLSASEDMSGWMHTVQIVLQDHSKQATKPIDVEITLAHDIGVSASYYKLLESEVLNVILKQ
jgi:hypothetical protein